jgi:hypothetical protein
VSATFGVFWDYLDIFEGFSKISKPMTKLLEKDKKFEWTSAYEVRF